MTAISVNTSRLDGRRRLSGEDLGNGWSEVDGLAGALPRLAAMEVQIVWEPFGGAISQASAGTHGHTQAHNSRSVPSVTCVNAAHGRAHCPW